MSSSAVGTTLSARSLAGQAIRSSRIGPLPIRNSFPGQSKTHLIIIGKSLSSSIDESTSSAICPSISWIVSAWNKQHETSRRRKAGCKRGVQELQEFGSSGARSTALGYGHTKGWSTLSSCYFLLLHILNSSLRLHTELPGDRRKRYVGDAL